MVGHESSGFSHQNRGLRDGDRRGTAGRIGAEWEWRAWRRNTLRRPGPFDVITPILASPPVRGSFW